MSNVFSINLNDEEVTDEHHEQGNIRDVQFGNYGFSQIDVTVRGATFSFSPSETVCIEEVISCQTQAKYSRKIMHNDINEMKENYRRYAFERLQLPVPVLLWIGVANSAKTLLLLDVFDEIGDSVMRNILKLLSDPNKNRMTIITMRKTENFKLRYEEMETVFKERAIRDAIWDREVNILRFTSENRQLVLEIFLEGNLDESTLLERINQVIAPLEILRVFVTRENSEHKSRRTDLLKNLVDCVVGQSTGENWWWCELGQNFSLLNITPCSDYFVLLITFDEMSVANILAVGEETDKLFLQFADYCALYAVIFVWLMSNNCKMYVN